MLRPPAFSFPPLFSPSAQAKDAATGTTALTAAEEAQLQQAMSDLDDLLSRVAPTSLVGQKALTAKRHLRRLQIGGNGASGQRPEDVFQEVRDCLAQAPAAGIASSSDSSGAKRRRQDSGGAQDSREPPPPADPWREYLASDDFVEHLNVKCNICSLFPQCAMLRTACCDKLICWTCAQKHVVEKLRGMPITFTPPTPFRQPWSHEQWFSFTPQLGCPHCNSVKRKDAMFTYPSREYDTLRLVAGMASRAPLRLDAVNAHIPCTCAVGGHVDDRSWAQCKSNEAFDVLCPVPGSHPDEDAKDREEQKQQCRGFRFNPLLPLKEQMTHHVAHDCTSLVVCEHCETHMKQGMCWTLEARHFEMHRHMHLRLADLCKLMLHETALQNGALPEQGRRATMASEAQYLKMWWLNLKFIFHDTFPLVLPGHVDIRRKFTNKHMPKRGWFQGWMLDFVPGLPLAQDVLDVRAYAWLFNAAPFELDGVAGEDEEADDEVIMY